MRGTPLMTMTMALNARNDGVGDSLARRWRACSPSRRRSAPTEVLAHAHPTVAFLGRSSSSSPSSTLRSATDKKRTRAHLAAPASYDHEERTRMKVQIESTAVTGCSRWHLLPGAATDPLSEGTTFEPHRCKTYVLNGRRADSLALGWSRRGSFLHLADAQDIHQKCKRIKTESRAASIAEGTDFNHEHKCGGRDLLRAR